MRPVVRALFGIAMIGLLSCSERPDRTLTTPTTTNPPAACTFTLELGASTFDAVGGRAPMTVSTASGCRWTATFGASTWIRPETRRLQSGSATLTIDVDPNRSFERRTATLGIADAQDRTVVERLFTQRAAGCLYSVDPASMTFDSIGTYYP
jgi:hypothetical protein